MGVWFLELITESANDVTKGKKTFVDIYTCRKKEDDVRGRKKGMFGYVFFG